MNLAALPAPLVTSPRHRMLTPQPIVRNEAGNSAMRILCHLPCLFLCLLLTALPLSSVFAAGFNDAAQQAEMERLKTSTSYADILRLYQLRYPSLPDTGHQFWATTAVAGLKELVPGPNHDRLFLAFMRRMVSQEEDGGLIKHILPEMVKKGLLKADSDFVRRLTPVLEEIDRKGQAKIDELREQSRQAQEQSRQAQEEAAQYRKLTEMLKAFGDKN